MDERMRLVPIYVIGHSHTGTSILRSVIGHASSVLDIDQEVSIDKFMQKSLELEHQNVDANFVIGKRPCWKYFKWFYNKEFESSNLHAIFVIRNPYYVFSSLLKRFSNTDHFYRGVRSFENFEEYAKVFHERKFLNPHPRIHCIRYEDFFENNHEEIKEILGNIGVPWDDDIFDNTKHINKVNRGLKQKDTHYAKVLRDAKRSKGDRFFSDNNPSLKDHHENRNIQINQPFVYADTDRSKICLPDSEMEIISSSFCMKEIYPDFEL